jgi:hypothetical protein
MSDLTTLDGTHISFKNWRAGRRLARYADGWLLSVGARCPGHGYPRFPDPRWMRGLK